MAKEKQENKCNRKRAETTITRHVMCQRCLWCGHHASNRSIQTRIQRECKKKERQVKEGRSSRQRTLKNLGFMRTTHIKGGNQKLAGPPAMAPAGDKMLCGVNSHTVLLSSAGSSLRVEGKQSKGLSTGASRRITAHEYGKQSGSS